MKKQREAVNEYLSYLFGSRKILELGVTSKMKYQELFREAVRKLSISVQGKRIKIRRED